MTALYKQLQRKVTAQGNSGCFKPGGCRCSSKHQAFQSAVQFKRCRRRSGSGRPPSSAPSLGLPPTRRCIPWLPYEISIPQCFTLAWIVLKRLGNSSFEL
ncbi:hypothetical protein Pyn_39475 [Prunus yedoensis var. nudiflora]|uniref:Uncharacterized protein n=1 Tax=Prunus yedoensis var. nudiflora TaxID=2094558 RepID=A0A314ZJL2_PRUYE|nr:hypothetical protein Pyn_39475 [Prunus yedoensis var. nudiflora]